MKSKTSINSEQAQIAQELVDSNTVYQRYIKEVQSKGYTPVFELIGKKNVIVIRYDVEAELVLLGIINNADGYIIKDITALQFRTPKMYDYSWDELLNIQETSTPDIEGFVTYTDNGMVKVKCKAYCEIHKMKDSINNSKALCMLILNDSIDDLMSAYEYDIETINYILTEQNKIFKKYNHLVKTVEDMYNRTKRLDRKEYAIFHKEHEYFPLLMSKYLGKEVKYKGYFIRNKMYRRIEENL